MIAIAAAHLGDTATVSATKRWIDEYEKRVPPLGSIYEARAMIILAEGDRTAALGLLRAAIAKTRETSPMLRAWRSKWQFAPLRGDPRWAALLAPLDK